MPRVGRSTEEISKFFNGKHKVPPSYSRADDYARSLNGRRDDELKKFALMLKVHHKYRS
jgi:hypothetical protein